MKMQQNLTNEKSTLVQVMAIIWASVDPDLCNHMTLLGHNELICKKLSMAMVKFGFGNIKLYLHLHFLHRDCAYRSNPFWRNTRTCVTWMLMSWRHSQGARASAALVLTWFSQNILAAATDRLMMYVMYKLTCQSWLIMWTVCTTFSYHGNNIQLSTVMWITCTKCTRHVNYMCNICFSGEFHVWSLKKLQQNFVDREVFNNMKSGVFFNISQKT